MIAYIDLIYFRLGKVVIPKELALYDEIGRQEVLIFKPPFAYTHLPSDRATIVRTSEKRSGLAWSDGYLNILTFSEELRELVRPYQNIMVRGEAKYHFLRQFIEDRVLVENTDDFKTCKHPKIEACDAHRRGNYYNCALKNVKVLKHHMDNCCKMILNPQEEEIDAELDLLIDDEGEDVTY